MRKAGMTVGVVIALVAVGCAPGDDRVDPDPPPAAAPQTQPGTMPPPVPAVPADSPGVMTEPFDTTTRTDMGAVRPDTAPR
jgi:hypothetical protein